MFRILPVELDPSPFVATQTGIHYAARKLFFAYDQFKQRRETKTNPACWRTMPARRAQRKIMKTKCIHHGVMALGTAVALGLSSTAFADSILLGSDYLETLPGTFFDFGGPIGSVAFKGLPINPGSLGTADTIVQRKADAILPPGGSTTIPIELVQLSLVSVNPITIGGVNYGVYVHLTPSTVSSGTMTIRHSLPDFPGPSPEGTFDSFFDVFFTADFTEVGNPFNTFSVSDHTQLGSTGSPWSHDPNAGALLVTGLSGDQAANNHTGRPPLFSDMSIPFQIVETKLLGGPGAHVVTQARSLPDTGATLTLLLLSLGLMGWRKQRCS